MHLVSRSPKDRPRRTTRSVKRPAGPAPKKPAKLRSFDDPAVQTAFARLWKRRLPAPFNLLNAPVKKRKRKSNPKRRSMYRHSHQFLNIPGEPQLGLTINLPPALTGRSVNGLPPYAPVKGHEVNRYPACPESWPRSEGTTGSFFIAVKEGHGMWLDFNRCRDHAHDVAVVVSIQGVNPLTGRKTDKCELEKYPVDPAVESWLRGYQNYLATTATPSGLMWIDGFRAQDGTVRQYVFTKDEAKGVAAQLIGVNRVFAIGATFFTSKQPKPKPVAVAGAGYGYASKGGGSKGGLMFGSSLGSKGFNPPPMDFSSLDEPTTKGAHAEHVYLASTTSMVNYSADVAPVTEAEFGLMRSARRGLSEPQGRVEVERIEISAGAEIEQTLYRDHTPLDYWNEVPAGIVVVSYASADEVKRIIEAGEAAPEEGFLGSLVKGNE